MRFLPCLLASLVVAICTTATAHAVQYSFSVANGVQSVKLPAGSPFATGEIQSTVVGANLKTQCPAGRFLISMDGMRPFQPGTVVGRDLNYPSSPDILSTFDTDPDAAHEYPGTNDDDIIALPNGDVLLIWGMHIDAPLSPQPAWFNLTYAANGNFGPGARRGTVVYRSTDCGNSFHYVSRIDPATVGDGLCGNPQPAGMSAPPKEVYANGGSDGQLARVIGNDVYFTMDCVGLLQGPKGTSKLSWVPSNMSVARVEVLKSTDEGTSWVHLGYIPNEPSDAGWRTGIALTQNGNIAFGLFNFLTFGKLQGGSSYSFDGSKLLAPVNWGWTDTPNSAYNAIDGTRVLANTVTTRGFGGDDVMVVFPATIKDSNNKSVDGYEMYLYDPTANQFGEVDPILPQVHAANHFLMHLAAIDPGTGPVLLYWYDIDANAKTATMRGRFVYDNETYSPDFTVATISAYVLPNNKPLITSYVFPTGPAWYGDYVTAGGYAEQSAKLSYVSSFHYYPTWVESDGNAYFSHVSVTANTLAQSGPGIPFLIPLWKPAPPPVASGNIVNEQILHMGTPFDPAEIALPEIRPTGPVTNARPQPVNPSVP